MHRAHTTAPRDAPLTHHEDALKQYLYQQHVAALAVAARLPLRCISLPLELPQHWLLGQRDARTRGCTIPMFDNISVSTANLGPVLVQHSLASTHGGIVDQQCMPPAGPPCVHALLHPLSNWLMCYIGAEIRSGCVDGMPLPPIIKQLPPSKDRKAGVPHEHKV